jgi:glycosyltransferase involved in cell wall biosynthesis
MSQPTFTFGYSTLASRLGNIVLPDLTNNPSWDALITVQSGDKKPPTVEQLLQAPKGERVTTKAFAGKGVAKLRNQVLALANGDYVIFADDDIVFSEKGIKSAIEYLEANPGVALVLGQAIDETGSLRKKYPAKPARLTKLNSARAATYEMIVRRDLVAKAKVTFDENFGAGVKKTYLGDEYIFICDLISAGLRCEYLPIVLATHPMVSSGSGWGTKKDRVARALIFDRAFRGNRTLPYLVRIAFGLKKLGKGLPFTAFFKFVFKR